MKDGKMKGWIVRDTSGMIYLYSTKPYRKDGGFLPNMDCVFIDSDMFPKLTWENSPVEVEITITPKKR